MPELPEVEVVRLALSKLLPGKQLTGATVRIDRLRQTAPQNLAAFVRRQHIVSVTRRGKYICLQCEKGGLVIHFGMTGTLRWLAAATPTKPHDHIDIEFGDHVLRYNDPRRFGLVLWHTQDPMTHPLLASLGLEPLAPSFTGKKLYALLQTCSTRRRLKEILMDGKLIVGVGNIYASESLYAAKLHPKTSPKEMTLEKSTRLVGAVRNILRRAIRAGGSTIRDFTHPSGEGGYFRLSHRVYGRENLPCYSCGHLIRREILGGRSSFWCPHCQPLK